MSELHLTNPSLKGVRDLYIQKYKSLGKDKFYRYLLGAAIHKLANQENCTPELDLLALHDIFVTFYRSEGSTDHLTIACICRKAAHKIYRFMLKGELTDINGKFLNIIIKE